jgi:catechol 2,3-dioxygenase
VPGEPWFFGIVTQNEKSHDLGFLRDMDGEPGLLHHVAFWVESTDELMYGAKFLVENGVVPDYGPGEHGIGEQKFLYFRDPVGLRYELNSGGIRNYVPDWEPTIWPLEEGPNNSFRNETGIPNAHMIAIPPGHVGPSEGVFDPGGPLARA